MRSAALTLALLIILSGASPAIAEVPSGVDGGQGPPVAAALERGGVVAQVDSDRPATGIRIRLQANTDARWTITHRYRLTTETEVEAFRSFGESYEAGQQDVGLEPDVFRSIARTVSESTDRQMTIRDVERTATVERTPVNDTATVTGATPTATADGPRVNATGILQLSFTWTNFLEARDDGTLQLGDVFTTVEDETWLSSLGDDQRLTVVTPPGYVISRTSFPIQQQNGSLIIDGPREFTAEERLSVTYQETAQTALPWNVIVGGVVVVALVVGFVVLSRRDGTAPADGERAAMTNGGETQADAGGAEPHADGPDGPGAASETGARESDPGESDEEERGDDESTAPEPDDETDIELLSDEERVERLLRERGGRMKQATIVKETGWSDAKVSQLLSAMADEGRVEKLRLGRENLISLPDEQTADDGDGV
jgi:hypothetical protein